MINYAFFQFSNDVGHIYICLWTVCVPSTVKWLVISVVYSCIFDSQGLAICVVHIILQFMIYLFILLIVSLVKRKYFHLNMLEFINHKHTLKFSYKSLNIASCPFESLVHFGMDPL